MLYSLRVRFSIYFFILKFFKSGMALLLTTKSLLLQQLFLILPHRAFPPLVPCRLSIYPAPNIPLREALIDLFATL